MSLVIGPFTVKMTEKGGGWGGGGKNFFFLNLAYHVGNLPTLSGVFLGSESLNNQETRLSLVIWSFGPLGTSKNSFLSIGCGVLFV